MPQNKQKRDSQIGGNNLLRGLPGYRTREGRSGLDPVDTPAEASYIEGVLIVKVFKFQARTRNPFYLIAMFVFGVIPFPALVALVIKASINMTKTFDLYIILLLLLFYLTFGVIAAFTGALSINFVLSIFEIMKIIPSLQRKNEAQSRPPKKNKPKRRKDYK